MTELEFPLVTSSRERRLRRRGFLNSSARKLLVTSACAAAVVGIPTPAHAEPGDPYVYVTGATDDTFIRALDGLKIEHPNNAHVVSIAREACEYIESGHPIREAVDGVKNSPLNLPLLQSAHFVAVARALYCPNTSDF